MQYNLFRYAVARFSGEAKVAPEVFRQFFALLQPLRRNAARGWYPLTRSADLDHEKIRLQINLATGVEPKRIIPVSAATGEIEVDGRLANTLPAIRKHMDDMSIGRFGERSFSSVVQAAWPENHDLANSYLFDLLCASAFLSALQIAFWQMYRGSRLFARLPEPTQGNLNALAQNTLADCLWGYCISYCSRKTPKLYAFGSLIELLHGCIPLGFNKQGDCWVLCEAGDAERTEMKASFSTIDLLEKLPKIETLGGFLDEARMLDDPGIAYLLVRATTVTINHPSFMLSKESPLKALDLERVRHQVEFLSDDQCERLIAGRMSQMVGPLGNPDTTAMLLLDECARRLKQSQAAQAAPIAPAAQEASETAPSARTVNEFTSELSKYPNPGVAMLINQATTFCLNAMSDADHSVTVLREESPLDGTALGEIRREVMQMGKDPAMKLQFEAFSEAAGFPPSHNVFEEAITLLERRARLIESPGK